MVKRKSPKPTKGIPPKQDSIQPVINFGFLFRRGTSCQLIQTVQVEQHGNDEIVEGNGNNTKKSELFLIPNVHQENYKWSKGNGHSDAAPCIQYTALLGCAELIQASLKDKHKLKNIFPYYSLLQTYKSSRSSSLSPNNNPAAELSGEIHNASTDGKVKSGDRSPHGKSGSNFIKSKRSSSVISVSSYNQQSKDTESVRFSSQGYPSNDGELSSSPSNTIHGSNDCNIESSASNSTSEQEELMAASQSEISGSTVPGKHRVLKKKRCTSCTASKTPYWREGWEKAILLCNACGIRYQKYKKYCLKCLSIARKDDKGRLHCPDCNEKL